MKTEDRLKEAIKKNPRDPMNYYYLGKELMKKPLKDIESSSQIEALFKKSIELAPSLWAPKILLGELLYKIGRFNEATPYFKESLKQFPEKESVKEYLTRCVSTDTEPQGKFHENTKRDTLYIFENNVREFIRILLETNYNESWWRKGVPKNIRATCAARREEGLDEEKDADLLLFADFHNYKTIIESNKVIFASFIDIKEWGMKLTEMEPIRNAIAHNRPLSVAPIRVREYSMTFQKILEKVRGKVT